MAHKVLVDGTAYEISGGRTLVNGTGYSIDKGKTLVGGTAYEVGFGLPTVILKLDAVFGNNLHVSINYDVSTYCFYTTPTGERGNLTSEGSYEFPIGTTISIEMEYGSKKIDMAVYLNDEQVAYSDSYLSYNHTLTTNITISQQFDWMGARYNITEE